MADDVGGDFTVFYRDCYRRTVAHVFAVVGDLREAEEISQEAFIRALDRWPTVAGYDAPEAWLRRVAFNLALNARRRSQHRLAVLIGRGRPELVVPPVSVEHLALAEALRTLPMRYRAVLVLHYLIGLPVQDVADELGLPEGTVKTRLRRGRAALSCLLSDEDSDRREEDVGVR